MNTHVNAKDDESHPHPVIKPMRDSKGDQRAAVILLFMQLKWHSHLQLSDWSDGKRQSETGSGKGRTQKETLETYPSDSAGKDKISCFYDNYDFYRSWI